MDYCKTFLKIFKKASLSEELCFVSLRFAGSNELSDKELGNQKIRSGDFLCSKPIFYHSTTKSHVTNTLTLITY